MSETARIPQIKGLAIRGAIKAIERRCPPGTLERMVGKLPDPIGPGVEHETFIAAGWYPLTYLHTIYVVAMEVTGRGLDLVHELSRDATLDDFRGIYRLLTAVLSPEFLMRRSPTLFNRYYDTGTLSVPEARKGYCRAIYKGCIGFDRILWEDVVAGSLAVLEACGGKNVRATRVRGGGDGDTELELVGEWR